ncbi:MAG: cyclopropane-fatty-acyl-phospholipid synthase [bacterium]|jgi:cyclopropane-fatty-acyl-phospholipid synthase
MTGAVSQPAGAARRSPAEQREYERARVAEHYEHHPEIFELVLDERLGYATAMFRARDEELDVAQARKYAWIAEQLDIRPGERALDVGCGWGSNLLYLAEHTEGELHGVTLSGAQRAHALELAERRGLAGRVRIDRCHIEDLELEDESLDAILFVGSVVHMHNREEVYERVARALKPGGRLLVSDCFFPREVRSDRDSSATRYIFFQALGYCRLLNLSEELGLIEGAGLDIARVEDLTSSYVLTLGCWIENVRRNRPRIEELSPGFARILQTYMTIAKLSFARRTALEYMVVATKGAPRAP